jgi:uncharacterized membrane protein YfcA
MSTGGGGQQKADDPPARIPWRHIIGAYVVAGVGLLIGWALWKWLKPHAFKPAPGISIFALLYIFAQATERILEPFSSYVGSAEVDGQKVSKTAAPSALAANPSPVTKATADQARRARGIVLWGFASALGMVGSGACGVLLLRTAGVTGARPVFDILVTGLAIGAGTKPLHDLISNIQKSKEGKEDAAATTGTVSP